MNSISTNITATRRPRPRSRAAFTLVEVMTATAIMVILVVFVLTIATNTITIYDNAVNSRRVTSESRAVLNSLTHDLQSAIIRNDGNIWLQIEHDEDVGNVARSNAPRIMLFAPVPERIKRESANIERIPGAVCAINYQIGHRSPFDDPGDYIQQIYGLYRAIIDAQGTFESALPVIVGAKDTGIEPLKFWEGNGNVLDSNGNRTPQSLRRWAKDVQNFQASNVVALSLLIYYQNNDTQKMSILAHSDIVSSVTQNLTGAQIENVQVTPYINSVKIKAGELIVDGAKIPASLRSIDIAVTVLDPEGDKVLRGRQKMRTNSKVDQQAFNDIVLKHGYTFTASVAITQQ
jgi:competence protein ComGC